MNNLTDRGLTADDGLLFVIDSGKALFHAIKSLFGDQALTHQPQRQRDILVNPTSTVDAACTSNCIGVGLTGGS